VPHFGKKDLEDLIIDWFRVSYAWKASKEVIKLIPNPLLIMSLYVRTAFETCPLFFSYKLRKQHNVNSTRQIVQLMIIIKMAKRQTK